MQSRSWGKWGWTLTSLLARAWRKLVWSFTSRSCVHTICKVTIHLPCTMSLWSLFLRHVRNRRSLHTKSFSSLTQHSISIPWRLRKCSRICQISWSKQTSNYTLLTKELSGIRCKLKWGRQVPPLMDCPWAKSACSLMEGARMSYLGSGPCPNLFFSLQSSVKT